MHPLDKAAYYVEYVARQKGAPFLKPTYKDLYWFQFYLLDVIAVVLAAILIPLYLFYKTVKYCCCGGSKAKKLKTH